MEYTSTIILVFHGGCKHMKLYAKHTKSIREKHTKNTNTYNKHMINSCFLDSFSKHDAISAVTPVTMMAYIWR